jgi:transcriptional regulator with XRE-family HTH domain
LASDTVELGARVRAWRVYRGLSHSETERRGGLAHNAVSRIEKGEVAPRLATLESIADALGINIEQLQFRLPATPEVQEATKQGAGNAVVLMEMLDALSTERRDEVVELLIQVVKQVRT